MQSPPRVQAKEKLHWQGDMLPPFEIVFVLLFIIDIKIITVITFDDQVQQMVNPDEHREQLKEAAKEMTGSEDRDVFMIANSTSDQEFKPA